MNEKRAVLCDVYNVLVIVWDRVGELILGRASLFIHRGMMRLT